MKATTQVRQFVSSTFTKANGAKIMRKLKNLPPIVPILIIVPVVIALAFWVSENLGWALTVVLVVGIFTAFWFPRDSVRLVKELDEASRKHWKVVCESAVEAWKVLTRKGGSGSGTSSGSSTGTGTP